MQVLFLEPHLHAHCLELPHRLERVHRIPGKAGDRLGQDDVDTAVQGEVKSSG